MYRLVPSQRASVGGADLDCTARYPVDQIQIQSQLTSSTHHAAFQFAGIITQLVLSRRLDMHCKPLFLLLGVVATTLLSIAWVFQTHRNRHSVGRRPPLLQYNGRTASRLIPVNSQTRKHSHDREDSCPYFSSVSGVSSVIKRKT